MTFWLNTADWFAPAALHAALALAPRWRQCKMESGFAGRGSEEWRWHFASEGMA